MNSVLSDPYFLRGTLVGAPLFLGTFLFTRKSRGASNAIQFAVKIALIGAVATAAISAIATQFSTIKFFSEVAGAMFGALVAAPVSPLGDASSPDISTGEALLRVVIGGVAGAILFYTLKL